jgi:mannose-6-phosphate isomerase-like protein (cupin superfamily)
VTAAVVQGPDISAVTAPRAGAIVTLLDVAGARGRLVRRLAEIPAGAARAGTAGPAGELWFVISGTVILAAGARPGAPAMPEHADPERVGAEHGIWLPPGTPWRLRAAGPARIDIVALPGARDDAGFPAPLVSDLRDCPAEVTGDRRFRVLFGPGGGGPDATQFVGEIPPGRAPEHSHPYDEVVLVLSGSGVVHLRGRDHELRPGTCVHLPPGQPHCLENAGPGMLRVLGVFHPGGSPAAKLPAAAG